MPPRVSEGYAKKHLRRGYTVQDHSGMKVRFDARFIAHVERNHPHERDGNRERFRNIAIAKHALKSPYTFDSVNSHGDKLRNYLAGFTNKRGERKAYLVRVTLTPRDGRQAFLQTVHPVQKNRGKKIRSEHKLEADL